MRKWRVHVAGYAGEEGDERVECAGTDVLERPMGYAERPHTSRSNVATSSSTGASLAPSAPSPSPSSPPPPTEPSLAAASVSSTSAPVESH